jgi:hypothetical protein
MFSIWVYLEAGFKQKNNILWVWGGSELIYKFLSATSID